MDCEKLLERMKETHKKKILITHADWIGAFVECFMCGGSFITSSERQLVCLRSTS